MSVWMFIPILLSLGGIFLLEVLIWLWVRLKSRSGKRNPLTRDLLRAPGESLRAQIDDVWPEVMAYMVIALLIPSMVYATYVSGIAFGGQAYKLGDAVLYVVIAGLVFVWACFKIWKLFVKKQLLALGYEAELAVGQELNDLARQGYYVFHDLPAGKFNIDHVVIGPGGVFAVETKGRAKPGSRGDGREGWKVNYNGKVLQFPTWQETEPLAQAVRQAQWLGEWLSTAVGAVVAVQPVVVLPGWYVHRTAPGGVPVLTGKQLFSFLPKLGHGASLDNSMIQRIVHQVDQRCRNIAPRAYSAPKEG